MLNASDGVVCGAVDKKNRSVSRGAAIIRHRRLFAAAGWNWLWDGLGLSGGDSGGRGVATFQVAGQDAQHPVAGLIHWNALKGSQEWFFRIQ